MKFVPTKLQSEMISVIENNNRSIILNHRQSGTTTGIIQYLIEKCKKPYSKIGILLHKKFISKLYFEIIIRSLDETQLLRVSKSNFEITLKNGSSIKIFNTASSLRGHSFDIVWVDDGHWNNMIGNVHLFPHSRIIISCTGISTTNSEFKSIIKHSNWIHNNSNYNNGFIYYGNDDDIDVINRAWFTQDSQSYLEEFSPNSIISGKYIYSLSYWFNINKHKFNPQFV